MLSAILLRANNPGPPRPPRARVWLCSLAVMALAAATGAAQAQQPQYRPHTPKKKQEQAKGASGQSTRQDPTGVTTPTRTRNTTRKTPAGQVETAAVDTLSPDGTYEPSVEVEEETVVVDARTTRVIRRLYNRDPDGRRRLFERTEEEHQQLPNQGMRIVRRTSHADWDGHFRLTREEQTETREQGQGVTETRTVVRQPDINGGLNPVEQVETIERETQPGVRAIDRTQLLPDGNSRWEAREKRHRTVTTTQEQVRTEEEVYRRDPNRQLSLAEKTVTREWQDAHGAERQTTEVYSNAIAATTSYGDARLHLDQRIEMTRRTRPDGTVETIQEEQERSLVAPGEPLRSARRTVELSRPVGSGERQVERTVQARDANGKYQTVLVLESREPAQPPAEKPPQAKKSRKAGAP